MPEDTHLPFNLTPLSPAQVINWCSREPFFFHSRRGKGGRRRSGRLHPAPPLMLAPFLPPPPRFPQQCTFVIRFVWLKDRRPQVAIAAALRHISNPPPSPSHSGSDSRLRCGMSTLQGGEGSKEGKERRRRKQSNIRGGWDTCLRLLSRKCEKNLSETTQPHHEP